jgi:predicted type IV restriction endonuclease
MKFIVEDKELKKAIKIIEQACVNEYGGKNFILFSQIGTAIEDGEEVLQIAIGTLSKEEMEAVMEITSKRKRMEFDKRLHRDFYITELERGNLPN